MNAANDVLSYEHIVDSLDGAKIEDPPEVTTYPPCDVVVEDNITEDVDDDYEYLILKSDHLTRGRYTKGKHIMQYDNTDTELKK